MTSLTQNPVNNIFAHYAFCKHKSVHPSLDLYAECFCSLDGDFSFACMFVIVQLVYRATFPFTIDREKCNHVAISDFCLL